MTDKERLLYETLRDFIFLEKESKEIRSRLASRSYKITASFSLTGGIGGNGFTSKVENAAIRELQLLEELATIENARAKVFKALRDAPLTETERGLAECMMAGQSLSSYARTHGLYISHVYKIRDKMLKKMAKYT